MNIDTLRKHIAPGEDSTRQFKEDVKNGSSGIKRALEEWPEINFSDDRDGCLFKAVVQRKEVEGVVSPTVSGKTSGKILEAVLRNNTITIPELAVLIGITERSIERNLQKLQKESKLKRVGPAKGGYWEVV